MQPTPDRTTAIKFYENTSKMPPAEKTYIVM